MNNDDLKKAAQLLGRLGGSRKSERKTNSSRLNAKRPRPNRRRKKQNEENLAEQ